MQVCRGGGSGNASNGDVPAPNASLRRGLLDRADKAYPVWLYDRAYQDEALSDTRSKS